MTARLAIVGALLSVMSVWTYARPRSLDVPPHDVARTLPMQLGEWIGEDAPPLDAEVAAVLAADQYVHRYYGSAGADPIEMDVAYYARPQAGAAMHSPLNCLPGNGWQVLDSRPVAVAVNRATVNVRRLVVARGEDRLSMTYWFQNRGAIVADEYRQRLRLLGNGLKGLPTDAALVRVMADDTSAGHEALIRFTRSLAAALSTTFR